jgi:ATP-binding cassette subfamily C (CFTR/MRP) protein 1
MRTFAPLVTLVIFVPFQKALGLDLTTSTAFTVLSLIAMLNTPISTLLRTIPSLKAGIACFSRIQAFLLSDYRRSNILPLDSSSAVPTVGNSSLVLSTDAEPQADRGLELQSIPRPRPTSKIVIDVRNASFGWSQTGPAQVNDVSFSIERGHFAFVIGPVGSGKSTLLKGLMSETPSLKGFIYSDSLDSAFADQIPWIQNATIQLNIVGPARFDKSWYEEVIKACALGEDIAAMPNLHGI